MKLQLLASAALMLLSAVPGVFSEEPSAAVAKQIESFDAVIGAIKDAGLYDDYDEEFDAEELSKDKDDKKKDKKKKSSRSSSNKKKRKSRSSKSRRRRSSRSSRRRRRSRRRTRKGMCGRNMRSKDKSTCRQLERRFCNSSRDRRRNRSICKELGFPTSEIENAPEDELSEDTLDDIESIVEEVEDELEEQDSTLDSQDSPVPSEDYHELEDEDWRRSDWRRSRYGRSRRRRSRSDRRERRDWTRRVDRARDNRWRGRSFDDRRYRRCDDWPDRWCDEDGNALSAGEVDELQLEEKKYDDYDWDDANDRPYRRDRDYRRRDREYRDKPWKRSADRARDNRWEGRSFEDDSDDCEYYGDCGKSE